MIACMEMRLRPALRNLRLGRRGNRPASEALNSNSGDRHPGIDPRANNDVSSRSARCWRCLATPGDAA
jgi:hypothetical protein